MLTAIRKSIAAAAICAATAMPASAGFLDLDTANRSFAVGNAAAYLATRKNGFARRIVPVASPVYGERCVTEIGSCEILPQPVGSPCMCGKVEGTTLQ